VGLDTFRPVSEEDPHKHPAFREYGTITPEAAVAINKAKVEGRKIICVGTTSARLLEYVAQRSKEGQLHPFSGWVDLFILPGYNFKVIDTMVTNFHLPRSTLLMMVSAFAGLKEVKRAYDEAIKKKYRFYSFGDAMLIM